MLELRHVRFAYGKQAPVLEDVSFSLERGECLCLLGPNGTGKTTLLRCLLGHLRTAGGEILLDGTPLSGMRARERAGHMAYVAQSGALSFPYTVEEVVLMGRVARMRLGAAVSKQDRAVAWEMMERLGIAGMAERNFQFLSGGERQMVLIARALTQQAGYLVLDEPTAALDYSNQIRILQLIRTLAEDGYGILMTSHFPDHAFLTCKKAVLMRDGRVMAFGTPDEVVTGENLTRLYRVPVAVTEAAVSAEREFYEQKVCIPVLGNGFAGARINSGVCSHSAGIR